MRILLSAYLDNNLGDDLFIDLFAERYRGHQIRLIGDGPVNLNVHLKRHTNVHTVGLKQALREMWSVDALVIMGGSIFQDIPAYYKYDFRRNVLVTLARLLGKAVFIVGCNIGPIHSKKGERLTRYCFALANAVSVRDYASFTLLRGWKGRTRRVVGSDLIFSYPLPPARPRSAQPRRLGISVVNVNRPEAETTAYVRKLAQLAEKHLKKDASNEVVLFAFNGGGNGQNDSLPIANILGRLPRYASQISVQQYSPTLPIREFLSSFASCDYVVCSRFHSVVLALSFGIPFFPIAYSDKTLNLLHDIGYEGMIGHYSAMDALHLEPVLADIARPEERRPLSDHYIETSRRHFVALDEFITRSSAGRRTSAGIAEVAESKDASPVPQME